MIFNALIVICLLPNAFAQSDFLDFSSNLFGGSTSTQDKDQFTNVVPNQTSGLSKFINTEYGFEFEFPSTWEVLDPFSSGLNMEGIPIQVASIRSTIDDGIHDLLTISVLKPSRYLDTDTMEVKTSNLSPQEHAKIVTDMLPEYGFKVVRENPVTVAGLPAYRIEYTTYEYETEVFVVKSDGALYKLEFGTPMLRAPESLPVFNKMVESFKFVSSSNISSSTSALNNQSLPLSTNSTQSNDTFSLAVDNSQPPIAQLQQFNTGNIEPIRKNNESNIFTSERMSSTRDQHEERISIRLNSAEFQTTESSRHQAKILVDYETNDSNLIDKRINGVLEITDMDGNEIKTTSYPDGFSITGSGIIQFASSIDDEDIDTVSLKVYLTTIEEDQQISNIINTTVSLDEEENNEEDDNSNDENSEDDNENN
jgi:hypothetical protein